MWIIKPARIREYIALRPDAANALQRWLELARLARWTSLVNVRQSFAHADEVKVDSGKTVVIFNIQGNAYRLITAIHYNMGKVFVLDFLTHAEYDRDTWKRRL